jgi:hypothetical protein
VLLAKLTFTQRPSGSWGFIYQRPVVLRIL